MLTEELESKFPGSSMDGSNSILAFISLALVLFDGYCITTALHKTDLLGKWHGFSP